ncbi:MAG TPA: preprotein translocase subunit SecE [Thermoanaerobaculia bacterium]|jgi:preprotein translocase subunit SecE|nr:preprotein translocase subunit SecE [Thermoanaerobaculia bacterium]
MADEKNESAVVAKPKQWWLSTREFFRDTAGEMKKVTWPTRNEVVGTTTVVIVATIVFALFLWGCDLVFYKAIDYLFTTFGASA